MKTVHGINNAGNASFFNSRSMSIMSKAANRSQIRMPVNSPSSVLLVHSFCMCSWAVIVECLALNPCWPFGSILLYSKNFVVCMHTIFSRTLDLQEDSLQVWNLLYQSCSLFENWSDHCCFPTVWNCACSDRVIYYF